MNKYNVSVLYQTFIKAESCVRAIGEVLNKINHKAAGINVNTYYSGVEFLVTVKFTLDLMATSASDAFVGAQQLTQALGECSITISVPTETIREESTL